jgi:hypothetical protein
MKQGRGCTIVLTVWFVMLGLLVVTVWIPNHLATVAIAGALLAAASLLLGVPSYRRQRLRDRRQEGGLCFECGYDLRGSVGPEKPPGPEDPDHALGQHRCPECGEPFDPFRI